MEKDKLIALIRNHLDEGVTSHLFAQAQKTDDLSELRNFLIRSKTVYKSFISDANNLILDIDNLKKTS